MFWLNFFSKVLNTFTKVTKFEMRENAGIGL